MEKFFEFIERIYTPVFVRRDRPLLAGLEGEKLTTDSRVFLGEYRTALMFILGGLLLPLLLVRVWSILFGIIVIVYGWKTAEKTYKLLVASLSKDAPHG